MRKILLLLTIILLCSCSKKVVFDYATSTQNIMYKSFWNPITLKVNNKKPFDVSVTNSEIKKINDSSYSIFPKESGPSYLVIKQNKKTDSIYLKKVDFPEPELMFWESKSDEMSFSKFRGIKSIVAVLKNFTLDCTFEIKSMDIIRIDRFKNITQESNNWLNSTIIKKAEIGDTYIFTNIKINVVGANKIVNGKKEVIKIVN